MDLELRTVRDEELGEFLLAVQTGFGRTTIDDTDEYPAHLLTAERSLAVRDGTTVVATAGAYPFRITVPGARAYRSPACAWSPCTPPIDDAACSGR